MCLIGDFNAPNISWNHQTSSKSENSFESKFIETIQDCFLYQHVNQPTRFRGTDTPSLLDMIFTNEEDMISDLRYLAPLGNSDHALLTFKLHRYTDPNLHKKKSYLYYKGDYNAMRASLEESEWAADFNQQASELNTDATWTLIKNKILELQEKYVPTAVIGGKVSWTYEFPISEELRNLLAQKSKACQKWNMNRHHVNAEVTRREYVKLRNKSNQMCRKEKRRYERGVAERAKTQPKAFWKYARSKLKTKSGIAPLLADPDDPKSLCHDDKVKAEILQKQFVSVFTREPIGPTPQPPVHINNCMNLPHISELNVLEKLSSVNTNKSCGPDEIHPRIIKELATYLAGPIAILYNRSIEAGDLPLDWKEALVTPIYKKGAKKLAANYRPISLTAILCKILESFISEALLDHLKKNNALSPKQYGFVHGRSTVLQMLHYLNQCCEVMSGGGVVDVAYLDYAKAFDSVPHRRLLSKLESCGVRGNIHVWIKNFLTARHQSIVVNGERSSSAAVLSGIPQGSVMGPILFIIYINDLPERVNSDIYMFADDTKILREIKSREDSYELQRDLDRLQAWSSEWLLNFNPSKCKIVTLGTFDNIVYAHRYTVHGHELEHVECERDLGIKVDAALKFDEHILDKIKLANSMMGLIRRVFSHLTPNMFKHLYTSFVRSHLEYAQAAWSPRYKSLENKIEQVQIRATKLVNGFSNIEYKERLRLLNIPTLKFRRHRGDMIEVWKHFNLYEPDILPASFKPLSRPSRQHGRQLYQHRPADGMFGVQRGSFYYRVVNVWNGLPCSVVEAESLNQFKNRLDDHWGSAPFRFDPSAPPPQPSYNIPA